MLSLCLAQNKMETVSDLFWTCYSLYMLHTHWFQDYNIIKQQQYIYALLRVVSHNFLVAELNVSIAAY